MEKEKDAKTEKGTFYDYVDKKRWVGDGFRL